MSIELPKKSGFVTAMVIVGLIAGAGGVYLVATTVYGAMSYRSETATIAARRAREATEHIAGLVGTYRARFGECPTIGEDLVSRGLLEETPRDPWGRHLVFDCSEDQITVVSPGIDGEFGTEDDIRATR